MVRLTNRPLDRKCKTFCYFMFQCTAILTVTRCVALLKTTETISTGLSTKGQRVALPVRDPPLTSQELVRKIIQSTHVKINTERKNQKSG